MHTQPNSISLKISSLPKDTSSDDKTEKVSIRQRIVNNILSLRYWEK